METDEQQLSNVWRQTRHDGFESARTNYEKREGGMGPPRTTRARCTTYVRTTTDGPRTTSAATTATAAATTATDTEGGEAASTTTTAGRSRTSVCRPILGGPVWQGRYTSRPRRGPVHVGRAQNNTKYSRDARAFDRKDQKMRQVYYTMTLRIVSRR